MLLIDEFRFKTSKIPYRPGAIFPSEMFLFYKLATGFSAYDRIIESGSGNSTLFLLALFPKISITTIDKHLNELFKIKSKRLVGIKGDSREVLPDLIKKASPYCDKIAVLIDGPKGPDAVYLAEAALKNKKVLFAAVHDLPDHLAQMGRFNTKDEKYREQYGVLDENVGDYLLRYPSGPGLTIFSNEIFEI